MDLKSLIADDAYSLGFSAIGVASADYDPRGHDRLLSWLDKGYNAEMKYMARETRQRFDPRIHLPNARSVIICALNYYKEPLNDPTKPYISIYARGEDYHDVLNDKLNLFCRKISENAGGTQFKVFADSGAFAEKWFAAKAGLGFFGRNGVLILSAGNKRNAGRGSFHFLAAIITELDLEPDNPSRGGCGRCRLCVDACPTVAIAADRVIDANRCIANYTTRNGPPIPGEIASKIGNIVYGCDICQMVCPFNKKSVVTSESRLIAGTGLREMDWDFLLGMTEDEYCSRFKKSCIGELKYHNFMRNVALASRNRPAI